MRFRFLSAAVAVVALSGRATPVLAHGPQLQISFDPVTGQLVTHQVLDTAAAPPALTPEINTYVIGTGGFTDGGTYVRPDHSINIGTGLPNYYSGPGIVYQYDSVLPGSGFAFNGSSSLPNLQGTGFRFNLLPGLQVWNGSAFVDAGAAQLQAFTGSNTAPTATATSNDATTASINFGTVTSVSGNPHSTVRWRLLDDGTTVNLPVDAGVYLLNLTVGSTATYGPGNTPVGDSDPFRFLLVHGVGEAEAQAALGSFGLSFLSPGVQVFAPVPEPATVALVGLAIAGSVVALRRRNRTAE